MSALSFRIATVVTTRCVRGRGRSIRIGQAISRRVGRTLPRQVRDLVDAGIDGESEIDRARDVRRHLKTDGVRTRDDERHERRIESAVADEFRIVPATRVLF